MSTKFDYWINILYRKYTSDGGGAIAPFATLKYALVIIIYYIKYSDIIILNYINLNRVNNKGVDLYVHICHGWR